MTAGAWFVVGVLVFVACAAAIAMTIAAHWADLQDEEAYEEALEARLSPVASGVHVYPPSRPFDRENEAQMRQATDFVYALHLIDSAYDDALGQGRN